MKLNVRCLHFKCTKKNYANAKQIVAHVEASKGSCFTCARATATVQKWIWLALIGLTWLGLHIRILTMGNCWMLHIILVTARVLVLPVLPWKKSQTKEAVRISVSFGMVWKEKRTQTIDLNEKPHIKSQREPQKCKKSRFTWCLLYLHVAVCCIALQQSNIALNGL